jgi:hypothetical protein
MILQATFPRRAELDDRGGQAGRSGALKNPAYERAECYGCFPARASRLATDDAYQQPPRADLMPPWLSACVVASNVVTPVLCAMLPGVAELGTSCLRDA